MPPIYTVWPGQNRFCCGGRCMTGVTADNCPNLCSWTLILVISTIYFCTAAPHLWREVSPAIPLLTGYLFLSTVTFLLLAQFTDPGIIPRKNFDEWVKAYPALSGISDTSLHQPVVPGKESKRRATKFCDTCKIYRPPRASHCRDCDNCVQVFDHHCPFVGNCVGQRNYKFFLAFVFSVMILALAVLVGFLIFLAGSEVQTWMYVVFGIAAAPIAIITVLLLGLSAYHACLVCIGKTTREQLKGIAVEENKYRQPIGWCTPRLPSLLPKNMRANLPGAPNHSPLDHVV